MRLIDHPEMTRAGEVLCTTLGVPGFHGLEFILEEESNFAHLIEPNARCAQPGSCASLRKPDTLGEFGLDPIVQLAAWWRWSEGAKSGSSWRVSGAALGAATARRSLLRRCMSNSAVERKREPVAVGMTFVGSEGGWRAVRSVS